MVDTYLVNALPGAVYAAYCPTHGIAVDLAFPTTGIKSVDEDGPRYRRSEEIGPYELRNALSQFTLFGDDPFLRMQAYNLAIVDQFVTSLEYDLLRNLHEQEATPLPEATFLSAQSQMWIFAAYELMRTWRQRAEDMIKWSENGGLEAKLQAFEKELGFQHFGRQFRAEQIKRVLADSSIIDRVRTDLKLTHILFARMATIRIIIAKHEVRGRKKSVALMPGYGRINEWCGSLDFELENSAYSMGYISRRDIADEIRALAADRTPPTDEMIREFDAFMSGPSTDSL